MAQSYPRALLYVERVVKLGPFILPKECSKNAQCLHFY